MGVFEDLKYKETSFSLEKRDKILYFKDAFFEQQNAKRNFFDYGGFYESLKKYSELPVGLFIEAVYNDQVDFKGTVCQSDNTCVIGLERLCFHC